jgi:hypothetical protein
VRVSGWWKYDSPSVSSVVPAAVPYTGGSLVTVHGHNFGPSTSWSLSGGAAVKGGRIEIMGWGVTTCATVAYISDSALVCRVPALSSRTHPVDKVTGKVNVQVVVSVGSQRSKQGAMSKLEYTSVPSYFACETVPQDSCFKCCRASCVVESFAGGHTGGVASSCDSQCYRFCGFATVA